MDNKQIARELIKVAHLVVADIKLGPKDKKVIDAFTEKKEADSDKLESTGKQLDGLWMGGKKIAYWEDGKIKMGDLGDRSSQTVQRALKKMTPKNMLG